MLLSPKAKREKERQATSLLPFLPRRHQPHFFLLFRFFEKMGILKGIEIDSLEGEETRVGINKSSNKAMSGNSSRFLQTLIRETLESCSHNAFKIHPS